jgi:alpha-2-macroglobulin
MVLGTRVRGAGPAQDVAGLVRWLIQARRNGRWGNTQENALAMKALVDYYRRYESAEPDFTATVSLGARELLRESFAGRTTAAVVREVPMAEVAQATTSELVVRRDGTGTAFFGARLTYVPDVATMTARDNGFRIERRYNVVRDGRDQPAARTFEAGDMVRVTLVLDLPAERRYVAVTDPLAAGFEPIESWFATTAAEAARASEMQDGGDDDSWDRIWQRGTYDHVERHDDRVQLFATRLAAGRHEFSYVVRATTTGTFTVAPPRAEEMYSPEVSGRGATQTVEVGR